MASIINLANTTPAPPSGLTNVEWQGDSSTPRNVSAYVPNMVGDTGSGGASGAVPTPAAGTAAALKFLRADGTWAVPGIVAKYSTTFTGATSVTVTHSLGTTAVFVAVWDSAGNQLIPEACVVTNSNTVTLTFGVAATGSVVVIG
jgi:hypothetical protein